jgi:hypothetical protein
MSDPAAPRPFAQTLQDNLPILIGPLLMIGADLIWLAAHGGSGFAHQALRNGLVFSVGVGGLLAALGHTVFRDQVAESIGWPTGSPFQLEVGFANLGIGVVGVMSAWYDGRFWLATIVVVSVFLISDAAGHVVDMVRNHNFAPNNAGFLFYWDVALPALLLVLYAAQ